MLVACRCRSGCGAGAGLRQGPPIAVVGRALAVQQAEEARGERKQRPTHLLRGACGRHLRAKVFVPPVLTAAAGQFARLNIPHREGKEDRKPLVRPWNCNGIRVRRKSLLAPLPLHTPRPARRRGRGCPPPMPAGLLGGPGQPRPPSGANQPIDMLVPGAMLCRLDIRGGGHNPV